MMKTARFSWLKVATLRATMISLPEVMRVSARPTRPSRTRMPRQKVMRLPSRRIDRGGHEESVADGLAGQVELQLQRVDGFVEAVLEDLLGAREGEFRAQLAEALLRRDAEGADRGPGDLVQRLLGGDEAEVHRARELTVQQQE